MLNINLRIYFKAKNMDLITWSSFNTFNNILYSIFNFYTSLKYETVYINYGDSTIKQILLVNSSKKNSFCFFIILLNNYIFKRFQTMLYQQQLRLQQSIIQH